MRSSNPALNEAVFQNEAAAYNGPATMSLNGTVLKTGILASILFAAAGYAWSQVFGVEASGGTRPEWVTLLLAGSGIAAFILAMITIFFPKASPFTAPLYAGFEGLLLGLISAVFEKDFKGIVTQAVMLTFGTFAVLLLAYVTRLIRATENFKLGVVAATGGIALAYLGTFILGLFGVKIPYIHDSGLIGIGFSVFVVIIAALNLVLDFDFIEEGVRQKAPKYMEWYAGFGLLVTLVWLYLEFLRLLAKLRSRD